ncbi:DUF2231 domain-containing protein [Rhodococcus olei]|uniref:DUF2231 domain-containing protein n=1 Tax=Rhodococcus olei TaxID=2161675 RepID=A0ABP8PAH3_9NOCA
MDIRELLQIPESVESLDQVDRPLHERVQRVLDDNPSVARILRGDWLGHPVHPLAVTTPVGAWTAAVALEVFLRDHRAARRLIRLGLACVPFAVVTGWTDWAGRDETERRAGLVHAAGNTAASLAMLASLHQRKRDHQLRGKAWSLVGLTAAAASGALGGHIAYGRTDTGSPQNAVLVASH